MKQTLMVKLTPEPDQSVALLRRLEAFNAACNDIAGTAFAQRSVNKFALQKLVYYDIRERFGLSAQRCIRAISKVIEAYMREPAAVTWLQERWPGSLRPAARRPKTGEAFICWYWRRYTSAAATFLSDMLPYLLVKREQADLAIEFQSHKSFKFGRRLTDDVLAFDEDYRARLLALRDGLRRAAVIPPHAAPLAG